MERDWTPAGWRPLIGKSHRRDTADAEEVALARAERLFIGAIVAVLALELWFFLWLASD